MEDSFKDSIATRNYVYSYDTIDRINSITRLIRFAFVWVEIVLNETHSSEECQQKCSGNTRGLSVASLLNVRKDCRNFFFHPNRVLLGR